MIDEPRITKVEKEKDPKRVASGKRLAAVSKTTKEKKANDRLSTITEEPTDTNHPDISEDVGPNYMLLITGVSVISGLICLYFTYKQDKRATTTETQPDVEQSQNQVTQKPVGNKLRSFD